VRVVLGTCVFRVMGTMVYEMEYGNFGRGYERHVGAALDVRLGRSALCTDGRLTCLWRRLLWTTS
jgi:hypothetical protein